MDKIVVGTFSDSKKAGEAVADLKQEGFVNKITVVAKDEDQTYIDTKIHQIKDTKVEESAEDGALTGTVLGGLAGLLAGAAAVGTAGGFVVIGPVATTLLGAAGGATLGTLTGALVEMGLPEKQVGVLTDRLSAGDVVITAHVDQDKIQVVETIMKRHDVQLIEEYI